MICGAATVHHDRPHADEAHRPMSSANEAEGIVIGGSDGLVPPYFTTTVLPANRRMYRSASTSVGDSEGGGTLQQPFDHGASRGGGPAVSSSPRATFADCTAPPDAPFVRLSSADGDHRARALVKRADTWAVFEPSTDLVAGGA